MKLDMSTYEPFGLEAIETASRDKIAAAQTNRLATAAGSRRPVNSDNRVGA
jgi:hypothetical protein